MKNPQMVPRLVSVGAVGNLYNPNIPVFIKMYAGPASYSRDVGFFIELDDIDLITNTTLSVLNPIITSNGKIIVAKVTPYMGGEGIGEVDISELPKKLLIRLYYVKANTATGDIELEELEDGSHEMDGEYITVIGMGDASAKIVMEEMVSQP